WHESTRRPSQKTTPNIASHMTGKRKEIGLFGHCQSTNLRTVNHYFPQIARRTFFLGIRVRALRASERAVSHRRCVSPWPGVSGCATVALPTSPRGSGSFGSPTWGGCPALASRWLGPRQAGTEGRKRKKEAA